MKSDQPSNALSFQTLSRAVTDLKRRLQRQYERAYPQLSELIHLVLDEEEANAWELSFPHLFLPDLVEAHVARLHLQPVAKRAELAPHLGFLNLGNQLAPAY